MDDNKEVIYLKLWMLFWLLLFCFFITIIICVTTYSVVEHVSAVNAGLEQRHDGGQIIWVKPTTKP